MGKRNAREEGQRRMLRQPTKRERARRALQQSCQSRLPPDRSIDCPCTGRPCKSIAVRLAILRAEPRLRQGQLVALGRTQGYHTSCICSRRPIGDTPLECESKGRVHWILDLLSLLSRDEPLCACAKKDRPRSYYCSASPDAVSCAARRFLAHGAPVSTAGDGPVGPTVDTDRAALASVEPRAVAAAAGARGAAPATDRHAAARRRHS